MRHLVLLLATMFAHGALANDLTAQLDQFGIDPNQSFSGTRHIESKDGQMEMFIRQTPDKMRMDMSMGGQTMAVITRHDLGVNYMLMPAMRTYREVKTDEMMAGAANLEFSEVSPAGRETIAGYECSKYRAQFTDPQGGRAGGYYWVSDDGILMKVDMIYGSRGKKGERLVFTMRDLKVGEQDPAQFEIPSGYSKLGFGLGMGMGQLPGVDDAQEPRLAEELEDAASDEAKRTVVGETRDKIRKGLGKLFGRD